MIPRLIHPVWITFELVDRALSFYDQQAREPVRQLVRKGEAPNTGSQTRIKGQVSFYFAGAKLDYVEFLREGVLDRTVGYVSLRYKDMKKAGLLTIDSTTNKFTDIGIKKGDRIVYIEKRPVNLYVTGFKDFAHYPRDGQTMIQVNFDDRHPSSQSGDL
jgi:hypothetical protein